MLYQGGVAAVLLPSHQASGDGPAIKPKPSDFLPIRPFAYFDDVQTCTIPIFTVNLIFDYFVPTLHIIFRYFMNHFYHILKHYIESAGKVEIQKS